MNYSNLLNGIVLFISINGICTTLSSKPKAKEFESDYSSPFINDEQFADKQFIDNKFIPTFVNKDGILPTFENGEGGQDDQGEQGPLPTFGQEGMLPSSIFPTFDKEGILPTGIFPTFDKDGFSPSQILPTFGDNKQMNGKLLNIDDKSSNQHFSYTTKLIFFGIVGIIIIGLFVFYLKRRNKSDKYISITEDEYHQLSQVKQMKEAGERTPLISV